MSTRKQKRQDELRQAPVAEAIAIGTAAGGLVLGTIDAQGSQRSEDKPATLADAPSVSHDRVAVEQRGEAALPQAHDAPSEAYSAAAQPGADPQPAPAPAEQTADAAPSTPLDAPSVTNEMAAEIESLPNTIPAPVHSQLAADLSEQMTATLVKVIGSVEPGQTPADVGQSIADGIIASAQQIVAKLDIGALLAETQGLADGIVAEVDAPAIVADALGATSGIADGVLTEVSDLPETILGTLNLNHTAASLADLPSSLLGHDGPEGSGGMLSDLFYADGSSDSLAIPDLSSAAGTLVSDIGGVVGILGLSYVDAPDHQGGHGLNALSLL
jgi:hypothetical protein